MAADQPMLALLAETGVFALRSYVAVLLIAGGLGKMSKTLVFEGELADYRLLPDFAVPLAARLLPVVELAVGLLLLSRLASVAVTLTACVLLLMFAVAVAINLLRGRTHISCGCGGASGGQTISAPLVAVNLLLAALLAGTAPVSSPSSLVLVGAGLVAGLGGYMIGQTISLAKTLANTPLGHAPGKA